MQIMMMMMKMNYSFFLDATEVDAKHFKPTVSKHDSSHFCFPDPHFW